MQSAPAKTLFPAMTPNVTHMLKVTGGHTIYVQESGNPNGDPVILVHGGPGGGLTETMCRMHDPNHYRIIGFDQRGCGRSTPHAVIEDNTTWDLVADMERIRTEMGVDQWHVFGGSWGSTLSLAYAITHPERVKSLVLRGIFTIRDEEIRWFYQEGASWLFPDAFEKYIAPIPENERDNLLSAYHKALNHPDPNIHLPAARAWSQWEGTTIALLPDEGRVQNFGEDKFALAFARIENHYFTNKGFFKTNGWIYDKAHILKNIPTVIVHGRYDACTPLKNAWDLKKAMPHAELHIIPDAGHAISEPGILSALIETTEKYKSLDR